MSESRSFPGNWKYDLYSTPCVGFILYILWLTSIFGKSTSTRTKDLFF